MPSPPIYRGPFRRFLAGSSAFSAAGAAQGTAFAKVKRVPMGDMKREGVTPRRRIKGVLFDFDGTLTSPGALDFPAIKREMGCPQDRPILEYLDSIPAPRRSDLEKILEAKEEEAADRSLPNTGAEKCLTALRQKGIILGIITRNSLKSVCKALLKFHGVTESDFAAIITRKDALPKPHPDGVNRAAMKMGVAPAELMVVGDFRFDVMAGNAAGSVTALLQNSSHSVMACGDPEPDYTISNLEEILALV